MNWVRSSTMAYFRRFDSNTFDPLRGNDHFPIRGVIPTTKIGVLDAVMRLLEQSDEHLSYLQTTPLAGHAGRYLTELATQLTMRGGTTITEEEARTIVNIVCQVEGCRTIRNVARTWVDFKYALRPSCIGETRLPIGYLSIRTSTISRVLCYVATQTPAMGVGRER